MTKSLWKKIRIPLFLALGIGLLYLTLKDVDFEQVWSYIEHANLAWVGLSFVIGYIAIVSRGLRWKYLLEPIGYPLNDARSVHAVAFGYFANLGVPRSGEIARCTILNQTDGIPVDKLFGTVILERVIDTIMLALLLGLAFFLNVDVVEGLFAQLGSSSSEASTSSGNLLWYLLAAAVIGGVLLLLLWKRIVPVGLRTKVEGFLQGIWDGLKTIGTLEKRSAFIAHTLVIWVSYVLMSYVCVFAFEETSGLDLADGLFLMVAGGLGMLAPVQGGLGPYHTMVALAFVALGGAGALGAAFLENEASYELGVAFAWTVWASQTLMIILGGLVGYLSLILFIRNKDQHSE